MQNILHMSPMLRAIGVISIVAVLVASVTFAALSDTATLTGNTMASDTADLQVSNGGAFGDSVAGFNPVDIVPGEGSGEIPFYLKNGSDFDMTVSVKVPTTPTVPGVATFDDVLVTITGADGSCGVASTYTMTQLLADYQELPCNPLDANSQGSGSVVQEGNFTIDFDFNPDGVSGSSASVDPFDLMFNGEQVVPAS